MADRILKVEYYKVQIPDKPGEGAKLLGALRDAGVNLLALTGFPRGRKAQVDLVAEDAAALKKAARQAGIELGAKKKAFLVQGDDRAGAIAEVAEKLAGAGINIVAIDAASAGGGRYAAILWVDQSQFAKAARTLGAS
jgi:hypothetical protein